MAIELDNRVGLLVAMADGCECFVFQTSKIWNMRVFNVNYLNYELKNITLMWILICD